MNLTALFCRVLATVSYPSPTGAGCAIGGETLRRWDGQTQQMVDVIPEETFHEQKFGLIMFRSKQPCRVEEALYSVSKLNVMIVQSRQLLITFAFSSH